MFTLFLGEYILMRVQRVHCQYGHAFDRDEFQDLLSESNPEWKKFADELEITGKKLRTNPDGDVGTLGFKIGFSMAHIG